MYHHQSVKKTSRPEIDTLEDFKREYSVLFKALEDDITNAAQYERVEMEGGPNNALINNLNRLKLHRTKLKDMLTAYAHATDKEWQKIKPLVRETFEKAYEMRELANREIAD